MITEQAERLLTLASEERSWMGLVTRYGKAVTGGLLPMSGADRDRTGDPLVAKPIEKVPRFDKLLNRRADLGIGVEVEPFFSRFYPASGKVSWTFRVW
jgi:hypothetical protein